METLAVVILAAGKGKRMNSDIAKVLQPINEKPMIHYVVDTAVSLAGKNVVVVVGTQADHVKRVVSEKHPGLGFALQENQLGTGHAASCAIPVLSGMIEQVLILCGDVPFIKATTLAKMVNTHIERGNAITVLGATVDNPTGYGRLIVNGDKQLQCIVEEADATVAEKQINLINTGVYCVQRGLLEEMLTLVRADNAQNEFYLTDIVGIGASTGYKMGMIACENAEEAIGINTRDDLQKAAAVISTHENP